MQRGDVRKKEQTNRLNLHVRVCEDDYQHVQIEYFCPFNLSNVAPLHKIILGLLKIVGDRYINSLFYYWCNLFYFFILIRENKIRKFCFLNFHSMKYLPR